MSIELVIQIVLAVIFFSFIYFNHNRINNIELKNDRILQDTRKKINALNTVLLRKYEEKQNIDSKIIRIVIDKLNALTNNVNHKDTSLQTDIDNLKRTLTYLQEQKTLFYKFDEEST
jgi:ABC-type transporter Mla subunit MlaD